MSIVKKRSLFGVVVSNKMVNTVTVLVKSSVKHPKYAKYVPKTKKYHAHAVDLFAVGDFVEIQESRPISKTKSWIVVSKLDSAQG
jgi:small subunit ribosomal protein S17